MTRGLPTPLPDKVLENKEPVYSSEDEQSDGEHVEHEQIFKEPNIEVAPLKKGRRRKVVPPEPNVVMKEKLPRGTAKTSKKVFKKEVVEDDTEQVPDPVVEEEMVLTANGKLISKKKWDGLQKARKTAAFNREAKKKEKQLLKEMSKTQVKYEQMPLKQQDLNQETIERIAEATVRKEKARRKASKTEKNKIAEIKRQAKLELLQEQQEMLATTQQNRTGTKTSGPAQQNLRASDLLKQPSRTNYGYMFNNF